MRSSHGVPSRVRHGQPPRWLLALAAAFLVFLLSACSNGSNSPAVDSRRLLLGHGAAPDNPRSTAADLFSERVGTMSDGRLRVQVLGQESVGSDSQMMISVASGTLDMTANSQGPMSPVVPEINLVGLPFLFESSEHAYQVLDGEVGEYLADLAESKGYHVLAWWDNGIRDVTNNTRPIEEPADLRGLQIRTPDDPMAIDIFNGLGASPTPMAFGELYLALRQGAVDGQENPVVNVKSSSLQEVQTHLAVTGHMYQLTPFLISTQTWSTLSPQDQALLEEAAIEARDFQREQMLEQTEDIYAEFEQIMQVSYPDRAPFRAATQSVYDTWQAAHPEFFSLITEAADASRAEHEQEETG